MKLGVSETSETQQTAPLSAARLFPMIDISPISRKHHRMNPMARPLDSFGSPPATVADGLGCYVTSLHTLYTCVTRGADPVGRFGGATGRATNLTYPQIRVSPRI